MTSLDLPLLVIDIGGVRVGYFERPDGGADWPWISLGDLLRLTGYAHGTQVSLAADCFHCAMDALTPEGLVRVIPEWAAYGTMQAAINMGTAHVSALDLLRQGERIALAVLLADVPEADWGAWFASVEARPLGTAEEVAR